MLDGMSDSIQRSRRENLHSREVDRQSPTGLIFGVYITVPLFRSYSRCNGILQVSLNIFQDCWNGISYRLDTLCVVVNPIVKAVKVKSELNTKEVKLSVSLCGRTSC